MRFVVIVLACVLLIGCSTGRIIEQVPVYVRDTVYDARELRDSVIVERWHTEYRDGDSVFVSEIQYVNKSVSVVDTKYVFIEKPIPVTKTEIVEVDKPIPTWQKLIVVVSVLTILGFVIMIKK